MRFKIIFLFVIISFSGCKSQKKNSNDFNKVNFKYSRLYYKDSTIVESDIYDSYTGLYESKEYNFGFGNDKNISTTIKFSEKELKNIYALYLSLNPKHLCECTYIDGKLLYKSSITFKANTIKNDMSKYNDCPTNEKDHVKYSKIEKLVYDLITNSQAYRRTFYWEFIKK
ncbi:hypothetical protein [Chryseobacterium aquaticum]|uniref:hypothetical protein n=1 Tax=Chryseobacterium aquaticum TaxID=452084 RepID=UPI003F6E631A